MARHRRKSSDVKLNLAAMLDMAFQLLAFFVLTFKPDPAEGQIQLRLPPPEAVKAANANAQAGQDKDNTNPIEGIETLVISVFSNGDGSIQSIQVGDGEVGKSPLGLETRLGKIFDKDNQDIPFKQVIMQVGSKLRYDELMRLIDVCTRQELPSGEKLTKLSFVELPEGEAGAN
jgi:biopolymer transport protein ExbD